MSDFAVGLACAAGSVLLFGSNYLPVKKYDVGDGLFFQLCLCAGIWSVGFVVATIHPYSTTTAPAFEPLAAFGGALWCTGQLAVVPIVKSIGIAKGLIIWGSTAMLAGWACGVFGLLGIRSQAADIHSWPLNIGGLLLALCSLGASLFLRPEPEGTTASMDEFVRQLEQGLLPRHAKADGNGGASPSATRGTCLALAAGLIFGTNFNPAQHVMDRAGTAQHPHASTHGLDYVPSQFSGIFFASVCWFAAYAAHRRNAPAVYPQIALPAVASGVMWGVADALWFVANEKLGFAVAFPIVLSGPGIVASCWSFFYLGELRGVRNALLAALVAALTVAGAVLTSLSRL